MPFVSVKRTNVKYIEASSNIGAFEFALIDLTLVRFTPTKGTGVPENYVSLLALVKVD